VPLDQPQQRGFTGSIAPDEADFLALLNAQCRALEEGAVAKMKTYILYLQHGRVIARTTGAAKTRGKWLAGGKESVASTRRGSYKAPVSGFGPKAVGRTAYEIFP
ncbi:MAG: hypothetical protein P8J29_05810, partial [Rhodospirillales bacterium]|nr:hypothetical protein [Rhodospirillales bacterium]